MTTEFLLEWIVLAAVQSSLLIVAVLFFRRPVMRWLGARWAYYLWLVPLLGLLASVLPRQPVQQVLGLPPIGVPAANGVFDAVKMAPGAVLAIWAAGILLTLVWFVARSIRFNVCMQGLSRELTFEERVVVRKRCARLARRIEVDFRLLSTAEGPAVAGLFQPVLLLPADFFQRYSEQQQALMLMHELEHLCRRDLLALFLARVYRCLFWFNPLAWLAERSFRLDQELSCDERVVSLEAPATRRLYGETMLLVVHPDMASSQVAYPAAFSQLRQRTALLRHHRQNLLAAACGVTLLFTAVGGSAVFGALGALEPEEGMREARALIDEAEDLYAKGEHVEALRALVRSETLDPNQYAPETWALRGLALAKLKQWDQAQICLSRAIQSAEARDQRPEAQWLLAETVMKLNRGDLEGAAHSLNAAKAQFPETSFEQQLHDLNQLVQENWEPKSEEDLLVQY